MAVQFRDAPQIKRKIIWLGSNYMKFKPLKSLTIPKNASFLATSIRVTKLSLKVLIYVNINGHVISKPRNWYNEYSKGQCHKRQDDQYAKNNFCMNFQFPATFKRFNPPHIWKKSIWTYPIKRKSLNWINTEDFHINTATHLMFILRTHAGSRVQFLRQFGTKIKATQKKFFIPYVCVSK